MLSFCELVPFMLYTWYGLYMVGLYVCLCARVGVSLPLWTRIIVCVCVCCFGGWCVRYRVDQMIPALSCVSSKFNGYTSCKFNVIKSDSDQCLKQYEIRISATSEKVSVCELRISSILKWHVDVSARFEMPLL